jgi:hypothetical protein
MLGLLSLSYARIVAINFAVTMVLVRAFWEEIKVLELYPEVTMEIVNVAHNRVAFFGDPENSNSTMFDGLINR